MPMLSSNSVLLLCPITSLVKQLTVRNTAIPEANKQKFEAKNGLENCNDQLVDDRGDVTLLMHKGT